MKRNVIWTSLVCTGLLALSWNNLSAQSDPTAPTTPAPAAPANPSADTARPAPPMLRPRPPRPGTYQRALFSLQQTKLELQHATNDFDGHRESALAACDKAITELEAVMKAAGMRPMPMQPRPQMRPMPQPAPAPQPAAPAAPPQQ